ncbi:MAG: Phosphoglycolate phosphatase [Methanocella sp. PtaU1.Bin125]|nr:MAG: Phosphoglycolate phosphatase [Methanocella sp. PtaU1.Bin125]
MLSLISMRADFKDIKAIVVDIDGTLTDMKRLISLEAVQEMRRMPIPVILSSGNVVCFVRAAAKLLGASDLMIGENGGVVQAGFDAKPFVLADIEQCRRARDVLLKEFPGLEPLDETYRKSELAFRRNIDVGRARQVVAESYPELEIVDTKFALHLKHRNVNKATGMLKLAAVMGIGPENFAAMGDSANDLHMLKAAGIGIAVGNAGPEVKAAADYVTKASYGEGAAEGFAWLRRQL